MLTKIKSIAVASLASAVLVGALSAGALANNLNFIPLTLINGWKYYAAGTRFPTGAIDKDGVVHLRGALYQQSGTNAIAFVLPPELRPSKLVYIRADMYSASTGRLDIYPDGTTYIVATGSQSDAQQFTSLEGLTYSKN
jgi:hypothetical protein